MSPSDAADSSGPAMLEASPEVVAVLVENHRRFLAFLERRVGSRDLAEDILQDAFVRGLARAGQVRDRDSVVAWFYRSLRNALADHWRRRNSERRIFEEDAVHARVEPSDDPELLKAVCECATALLDTLKPEYADALRRVELDGISVKDFAMENNVTPNNASVRLFRAREALRRQVERCCGTCAEHGCLDCSCGDVACRTPRRPVVRRPL
jgi:RNA polymerase sigma factor (sigma-70 family)